MASACRRNQKHAQPAYLGFLALLWQIFLRDRGWVGFTNQIFCDSWVVGFSEGRPWRGQGRIGKMSCERGSIRSWIGWATKHGADVSTLCGGADWAWRSLSCFPCGARRSAKNEAEFISLGRSAISVNACGELVSWGQMAPKLARSRLTRRAINARAAGSGLYAGSAAFASRDAAGVAR
jgi:hypothetical protein